MPAPVHIPNRPLLPRLLLLFWIAEIAVGALFIAAGASLLGPRENGGAIVLMLMGAVLALAGIVLAGQCWRVAMLAGNAIEMTDEGLLDRRLSARAIPWGSVRHKVIFNGRSYSLQADIDEPARSTSGIGWAPRAMGLFSRLLRQPEFTIMSLGTGLSAHDIATRMAAFTHAKD